MKAKVVLLAVVLIAQAGVSLAATSFADQTPPPAPDYHNATSWAARPGMEGPALAVAPGATPIAVSPETDVFYVNPTTYRSKDRWNQDIADAAANLWTDQSVVARQAGAFNGCCRIFAPRYRQASSLSFTTMAGDGGKAFDLAYGDVLRAFDFYMAHDNHGRPFILVGHSQGAFHLARLIEERLDGTPAGRRMVAAYIIGFNLSEGDFGKTYKTVTVCATPAQTGCIVQWNSVLPQASKPAVWAAGEARYVQRYGDDPGKALLCINPLTFDRAIPAAGPDHSLGAAPGDPGFGPLRTLVAKSVGARCEHGQLIVETTTDLGFKPLPGGSLHYHDIGLFYADVRANAVLRVRAFLKARRVAKRSAM
jgi:pimeloyl-ACP methyl ester carboxylesterase